MASRSVSVTARRARRRGDPARSGYFIPHDMGDPAQRVANGIQGFAPAPAAPQLRLLRQRQTRASSSA